MKKTKTTLIILFSTLGIIFIGCVSAYFIYGSTLLNGYDEKTIIKSLSEDMGNPIEILAMQKFEDHLGVLYKDPKDKDEDAYNDFAHFDYFIKHSLYKNRYYLKGGSEGNVTCPTACALAEDELKVPYFIDDIGRDESNCIVYEADAMGNTVRKLDEFDVPPNEPYVVLKEYELLNIFHTIDVCGVSQDYPREYNKNYLEADKEWFNMAKDATEGNYYQEIDELYEKAFGEKP